MQQVACHSFDGEGLNRVYENNQWMVGIKNYKPMNDMDNFSCVERHHETDELFVLLKGSCILITAEESGEKLNFNAVSMEKDRVYTIPKGLWHNTITQRDTKLILIEASNTGMENSQVLDLNSEAIEAAKAIMANL